MSGAGKCPVCRRAECRLIQTGRCADAVRDQRDRAEIRVIELEQALRCAALNLDSAAVHLHDCGLDADASALSTSASAARRVLDGSEKIVDSGTTSVAPSPPACPNCREPVPARLAHYDDNLGCWQCATKRGRE